MSSMVKSTIKMPVTIGPVAESVLVSQNSCSSKCIESQNVQQITKTSVSKGFSLYVRCNHCLQRDRLLCSVCFRARGAAVRDDLAEECKTVKCVAHRGGHQKEFARWFIICHPPWYAVPMKSGWRVAHLSCSFFSLKVTLFRFLSSQVRILTEITCMATNFIPCSKFWLSFNFPPPPPLAVQGSQTFGSQHVNT